MFSRKFKLVSNYITTFFIFFYLLFSLYLASADTNGTSTRAEDFIGGIIGGDEATANDSFEFSDNVIFLDGISIGTNESNSNRVIINGSFKSSNFNSGAGKTCPTFFVFQGFDSNGDAICETPFTFNFEASGFGACSVSCGGGTQTQTVVCRVSDGRIAPDSLCPGVKPPTSQSCNTQPCLNFCPDGRRPSVNPCYRGASGFGGNFGCGGYAASGLGIFPQCEALDDGRRAQGTECRGDRLFAVSCSG